MADADIYSLFMGGQDAGAQAQAMADALRRRRESASLARNAGNVALLTGDRVLTGFGNAQMQQAAQGEGEVGRGEGLLAQAGSQFAGRQLQEALAKRQAEQHAADMAQRAQEGALGRGLQRELAGMENERARLKFEADKDKAAADKAAAGLKTEESLRNKLLDYPETKDALSVAGSVRQIIGASPTGAGDMRLLYAYLRALDPGSAVREGEFATAGKTGGLPGQVQGYYNALTAQGMLPDAVRAQVKKEATALLQQRLEAYRPLQESFRTLATQYGVDPSRVVVSLGLEQAGGAAPAAGGSFSVDTPPQGAMAGAERAAQSGPERRAVHDKNGKLLGYINPDGTEEEVQ